MVRIEDASNLDDSSDSDDNEVVLKSQYPSWRSTFELKEPFTFSDENSGVLEDIWTYRCDSILEIIF